MPDNKPGVWLAPRQTQDAGLQQAKAGATKASELTN